MCWKCPGSLGPSRWRHGLELRLERTWVAAGAQREPRAPCAQTTGGAHGLQLPGDHTIQDASPLSHFRATHSLGSGAAHATSKPLPSSRFSFPAACAQCAISVQRTASDAAFMDLP
ncbi:hypothetical protein NDU88_006227 [Pleurodeles waltl]|uniref:Uncharacterized protein n=1 Tax=Pleurodeles waltl TaxID=8319 RepID=A0AAV7TXU1_PLEWA|nr:hypothetical protein NDU88_006227 [Pleurodeles waltl]